MNTLRDKMKGLVRQSAQIEAMVKTTLAELKIAKETIRNLHRNRGKFPHSVFVDSSFFGTHVEMGAAPEQGEERALRATFFWHTGRPAVKIQTKRGVPPLELAVNEDGTLEVIEK